MERRRYSIQSGSRRGEALGVLVEKSFVQLLIGITDIVI